ncbi:acetamidase/formamidase family protein, partial [Chloroflexota bacterium]
MESKSNPVKRIKVDTFTEEGVIGPSQTMLGPVEDGGIIEVETAPGCWGPMITPSFKGGHEVTQPVAVAGAKVGDAIALKIKSIKITSLATASGTDTPIEGRFTGDPVVARKCPNCGAENPATKIEGIGQEAVRCAACGADATPFKSPNGYTIVLDYDKSVGVTVGQEEANDIAKEAVKFSSRPSKSKQNCILVFALADIPGVVARLRPFIGNMGTVPAIDMPVSHNAGDFGQFLVGAPHQYAITKEQLDLRTDGHMDMDSVREGAILICPVKVDGGGIYVGDMHAMQGDGEIAGHTTDVSGEATFEVHVIKGLNLEGPLLIPPEEDLPVLARPISESEWRAAEALGNKYQRKLLEKAAPIQVVGSGPNLNEATADGLSRAAKLFGMSVDEVKNRATITGGIEIGRLPGVVTVSLLVPLQKL